MLFKVQRLTAAATLACCIELLLWCQHQVNFKVNFPHSSLQFLGTVLMIASSKCLDYDPNLGTRLKYTAEQYCMSNSTAAGCSLGPSTTMPYICISCTSLATQRVKGYHKNAHGMAAKYILLELKRSHCNSMIIESSSVD